MTTEIEDQLMAGMREQVAGIALTSDVVGAAARRHQRRTAVQRSMYAAGVVGLAGALAAVLAVDSSGQPVPDAGQPPVASAEAPSLRLAAAVAASENISYQVKATSGTKDRPNSSGTTEGAFDPGTHTGYLNSSHQEGGPVYYERLIDGVRFVGSSGGKKWKQYPGRHDRLAYDRQLSALGASADPDHLFQALRQAQATITQTGDRTYHFESTTRVDNAYGTGTVTLIGDVTVGADNRIAKVTYEEMSQGTVKQGAKKGLDLASHHVGTLELSDYGTPVKVQRPTDVVVVR